MPYLPAFMDITEKELLVVGGGDVAARKIEKLLLFQPKIHLVSMDINEEVAQMIKDNKNIRFEKRPFEFKDLDQKKLAIIAIDDIPLQKEIFDFCQKNNQMCNCVDSPDYCNFIFPALVTRGDLTIGINTAGRAPYVSSRIRQLLDNYLSPHLGELVEKSVTYRESFADRKAAAKSIKAYVDKLFSSMSS